MTRGPKTPEQDRTEGTARPRGYEQVDKLSVPLPHGTEVTTRVERVAGDRRVPQGVVGRVVRARGGGFDVQVVGVGELWYARDELVPRKPGQLQFALRRAATWDALRPCVVLETVVGSQAWGLANESSDVDLRGVFGLPLPWHFGLADKARDLVSADGSHTYWELSKAVEQALRADPNTLEMLFVPSARATDPLGEWLLAEREAFVSKAIFGSFGRYAMSQLDKLTRSQKLAEHRDLVLEWLCEEPAPGLDEVARRLAAISPHSAPTPEDALLAAKTYLKQLYRSLWDQGLLEANDLAALTHYARSGGIAGPPAPASYGRRTPTTCCASWCSPRGGCATGCPPSRSPAPTASACWTSRRAVSRSKTYCGTPRPSHRNWKRPTAPASSPYSPTTGARTGCCGVWARNSRGAG
ncbi:MAG TPA: nucleotidyltransferase domain-containing protein [Archangium sp.]|jgi:hypothetical protein|uniref:DNA polymerase beta superfamily protein n=1 Tax=Archangium sp. TaxID=1872627 RepID=UPI002ED91DA9